MPRPHILLTNTGYPLPSTKLDPRYHPLGQPGPAHRGPVWICKIPTGFRLPALVLSYCFITWNIRHWMFPWQCRWVYKIYRSLPIAHCPLLSVFYVLNPRKFAICLLMSYSVIFHGIDSWNNSIEWNHRTISLNKIIEWIQTIDVLRHWVTESLSIWVFERLRYSESHWLTLWNTLILSDSPYGTPPLTHSLTHWLTHWLNRYHS